MLITNIKCRRMNNKLLYTGRVRFSHAALNKTVLIYSFQVNMLILLIKSLRLENLLCIKLLMLKRGIMKVFRNMFFLIYSS